MISTRDVRLVYEKIAELEQEMIGYKTEVKRCKESIEALHTALRDRVLAREEDLFDVALVPPVSRPEPGNKAQMERPPAKGE